MWPEDYIGYSFFPSIEVDQAEDGDWVAKSGRHEVKDSSQSYAIKKLTEDLQQAIVEGRYRPGLLNDQGEDSLRDGN